MSELKKCQIKDYPGLPPHEELRMQIKDWLAKEHQLTPDNMEAISLFWAAYDQLKTSRAQPDNAPLTLDELRGMDGEPVYMIDSERPARNGWCIVGRYYDGTVSLHFPENEYYEIAIRRGTVTAYRRKQEGGE